MSWGVSAGECGMDGLHHGRWLVHATSSAQAVPVGWPPSVKLVSVSVDCASCASACIKNEKLR